MGWVLTMRINSAQSGMTLIQMAGILLIISIMMVPFFQIQSLSRKNEVRTQSKGQVSDVAQALVKFALENGRYPLPANPEISLSDPSAGDEATEMWADEDERDEGVLTGPNNACGLYGATPPNNLMVCVDGAKATIDPTSPFGTNHAGNRVIIGTIPFTALGLTPAQSLDEFGSKMTYAVTYGLTKAATFSNDKGNIAVKDQEGGCDIVMNGANPSYTTHFVVISHGLNKLGAFPVAGGGRTCTGTAVKGTEEFANCNNDATFRLLSKRTGSDCTTAYNIFTQRMPGTNTVNTFDDLVVFRTSLNTGNWTAQKTVNTDDGSSVYQTYLGYRDGKQNIIIGQNTTTADQPLSPTTEMKKLGRGQVQVDCGGADCVGKSVVQANRVEAKYLCSTKNRGDNKTRSDFLADACFRIKFLTDKNMGNILGQGKPLNGMIVDNVNIINSPATMVEVRSGYESKDSGMLKMDRKNDIDQAQSPGLEPVDSAGSAYAPGGIPMDTCSSAGAKGINPQGKLVCN